MMLVKLGGSVVTNKGGFKEFRQETTARLAKEIANSGKEVIIVHGAGSFGHVLAKKYSLHEGFKDPSQLKGLSEVMADVRELNLRIMRVLLEQGLRVISIPPSACGMMEDGVLVHLDTEVFVRYLDLGMAPVSFGDVALDRRRGFGICSGDQIIELLARQLSPDRIIFCADVEGICTADPMRSKEAELIESVDRQVLERLPRTERCADVTGSIYGKLECMLRMADRAECLVINGNVEGRLEAALRGEAVIGSKIIGG